MDDLYDSIFKEDFILNSLMFNGDKVTIRREPMNRNKEHAFIHMTHEDYSHNSSDPNDRVPDFRWSERLPWVKSIIEHHKCAMENECGKILFWEELYQGYVRVHLIYEEERFLVVLEKRKKVYMIITSFYLDKDWELEKRKRNIYNIKNRKRISLETNDVPEHPSTTW